MAVEPQLSAGGRMAAAAAAEVGCQVFVEVQRAWGDTDAVPHPLRDITDLELEEIRQLKHPPETVSRVMECVHLILGGEGPSRSTGSIEWIAVLRTVVRTDFLRRVRHFDVAELRERPALVDCICRDYLAGPRALKPDRVRHASRAVVAFFGWTVALIAGALPVWPVEEVGGAEARREVFRLEAERLEAALQARQREEAQLAAARREEAKQQEAKRKEAEREEAARQAAEREEAARREAEEQEVARQEEKERQAAEEGRRLAEQERLEALARKKRKEEEALEAEKAGIFSPEMCFWDTVGNPERKFLEVEEGAVKFPHADFVTCCNVLTREPVRRGGHFFEFMMHRLGGEQWCGVTTDNTQAGMRVSGWNLKGWSYYSGNREANSNGRPALHVNKKVVQSFAHVLEGDIVGVLLDADRRGLVFLRNDDVQGVCELLPRNRSPLFLFTHVGAEGDHVEVRRLPPSQAPRNAVVALEQLVGHIAPVQ